MYSYIIGEIKIAKDNYIVIENNNIGYKVFVPNPYSYEIKKEYTLYLFNQVREEEYSLFGFKSFDELELFTKLTGVKGIGPKTALPFLATGSVSGIIDAINRENLLYLTKFPKIGEKLGKQIILDLKDKIKIEYEVDKDDHTEELISVLENLGYKKNEIKNVLGNIDNSLSIEEQIKESLKLLMK